MEPKALRGVLRPLFILLLLTLSYRPATAQIGCPAVVVRDTSTCIGNCIDITATPVSGAQTTSYAVQPIPFSPYPYGAGGGNPVLINIDDTWSGAIALPFNFCFFGQSFNQMVIGSNGIVSFDVATYANGYCQWPINDPIPSVNNPTNSIMCPYQDIDPSVTGDIYWHLYGTAPCRVMVVSWDNVAQFSCNNLNNRYQLALYETTNIIEMYITEKTTCATWNGGAAIQGIQDASGTQAFWVAGRNFPTQWNANNEGWAFIPNGAPNYTLNWYELGNPLAIATTPMVNVCPTGPDSTQYVAEVIYNNCGAGTVTVRDTMTVHLNTVNFSLNTVSTDVTCRGGNDGTATTTPNAGTAPFVYQWSNGGSTASVNNLTAGTHYVTVTDICGIIAVDTVTIVDPPALTGSLSSNPVSCFGGNDGTASASASGGTGPYSWLWDNGQNTQNATGLGAGPHSCTITDACGESITLNVTVTEPAALTAQTSFTEPACFGGSNGTATVTNLNGGTPGYTYLWSNGQTNPTATGLPAGNASVTVTDANGCTLSLNLTLTQPTLLTVSTSFRNESCAGTQDGWMDADAAGGTPGYTYLWSNGATTDSTTGIAAGNYTVIVTDANGCQASANVVVTTNPLPLAEAGTDLDICERGPAVQLNGSGSGGQAPYTFAWTCDAPLCALNTPTLPDPAVRPPVTTTYYLVVTDALGCISLADSMVVTTIANPETHFAFDRPCHGDSTHFTDLTQIDSGSVNQWIWTFGDGGTGNVQNPVHIFNAGQYLTTLETVSAAGCRDTLTRTVDVFPAAPTPISVGDTVCPGQSMLLTLQVPPGMYTEWFYTINSPTPFLTGPSWQVPPVLQTAWYYVQYTTPDGCKSDRVPVFTGVYPTPSADITVSSREVEIPNAVVEFGLSSPHTLVYTMWTFGDGGSSPSTNPVHQYTQPGYYTVTLDIANQYGCHEFYELYEWIEVTQEILVFAPNAFTPNDDGRNDEWFVTTRLVTSLSVDIYDRWGKLLYHSDDLNFHWDGRDPAGEALTEGAYVYVLNGKAYDGSPVQSRGSVTLLR